MSRLCDSNVISMLYCDLYVYSKINNALLALGFVDYGLFVVVLVH